ncbi:MAG: PEGA domain-containing protein [Polyangiaceae bacterium]|nr:PEGA domain-containing protein [Polyangiaceae bacterium]
MRAEPFALAALLWAVPAWSDTRDPAAAEALFAAAREDLEAGRVDQACEKFAESQRLDPAAGTLINLAACNEQRGKLALAWEQWRAAQQLLPRHDPRHAGVTKRSNELAKRVPRLTLSLPDGAPPSTRIVRDGVELGRASLGVPLPVDPGNHTVVVHAPGHEERAQTITLTEGETVAVVVELGGKLVAPPPARALPAPARPAPTSKPAAADSHSVSPTGLVLMLTGTAVLLTGTAAGLVALSAKGSMDDDCSSADGRRVCGPDGLDAAERGKRWATISTICFAGGALLVGGGVYVTLSSAPKGDSSAIGVRGTF